MRPVRPRFQVDIFFAGVGPPLNPRREKSVGSGTRSLNFFLRGGARLRVDYDCFHTDKEDAIGKPAKTTLAKRDREKAKQMKQREKEARRVQRKAEKAERRPHAEGEDPDLAGLHWGPQEPLY